MPSLDNAYELCSKLNEEGIQHLLICIQQSKENDNATYFLNIKEEKVPVLTKVLKDVLMDLDKKM